MSIDEDAAARAGAATRQRERAHLRLVARNDGDGAAGPARHSYAREHARLREAVRALLQAIDDLPA